MQVTQVWHADRRHKEVCNPPWTADSTAHVDWTVHQIAPYIGRMKTTMARGLLQYVSKPGDLIVDPFCGSGVVALEAAASGRRVVAGALSANMSETLTRLEFSVG